MSMQCCYAGLVDHCTVAASRWLTSQGLVILLTFCVSAVLVHVCESFWAAAEGIHDWWQECIEDLYTMCIQYSYILNHTRYNKRQLDMKTCKLIWYQSNILIQNQQLSVEITSITSVTPICIYLFFGQYPCWWTIFCSNACCRKERPNAKYEDVFFYFISCKV